jgi:hypothetical protein
LKRFLFLILFFLTYFHTQGQVISLTGGWRFHIGDRPAWSTQAFNDTEWETIYAPSAWEDEGFNGYDGFAWYRKKFDGRQLTANENYYLNLGFIDDADEVYVNGILIGFSGSMPPKFKTAYNSERKYPVPTDLINFKGDNVIAIRVFDTTISGGIVDGRLGIYRAPKSRLLVDLQGLWSFATSWFAQPIKDETDWKKIIVPAPWEHQGYFKYDGYAWYKKTFTVPDQVVVNKDEDLVLLVGKIDDFDKTYLNGKLIGTTNDGRRYGQSTSFGELRAYSIPPNLLKKGVNTVEILVEDMGNVGGIYEGPVGIATRTAYERYFR